MPKKNKLIKKACLNLENKPLCLFIIIFAVINIFLILFLYTSCRGIAYGENGRFAVGMESGFPVSETSKIFFYDEKGELESCVSIENKGRSQGEMYCDTKKICYKVYGNTYYFDYSGAELNDISESEKLTKCGYEVKNNAVSVVHKKHLGLEYIVYNGCETRVHIYFKVFFGKVLQLLLMSPFIMYAAINFRKSMVKAVNENIF